MGARAPLLPPCDRPQICRHGLHGQPRTPPDPKRCPECLPLIKRFMFTALQLAK